MKNTKRILSVLIAAIMVLSVVALAACKTATDLSAPQVTINDDGVASWKAVENASGYKYKINDGEEKSTDKLSVTLADGQSIQVKAVGDGKNYNDSAYSAKQTYTAAATAEQLKTPVVTVDVDGVATWAAITGATSYKYKIDNGDEQTAPANRAVTLTDGQSIQVKAVGDGENYTDSAYCAPVKYEAPEALFYMRDADVIVDGDYRYLVYTTNKTDADTDNVIAIKKGEKVGSEWIYGDANIAIEGGEGWDKYIGSASIAKGVFSYKSESYNYVMAYSATDNSRDYANGIGLAVAKDPMGSWVKVGESAIIAHDSEQYGANVVGNYAPSVVNYNKQSGIRIYYTYADMYGHFGRFADADMSNLDNIDLTINMMLPTNGNLHGGDNETMFPNADWAYDATSGKFFIVKDYSPSAASVPSFADKFELAEIDEAELYTTDIGNGWKSLALKDYMDLTLGDYGRVYSACIVSDAYGHIIDANRIEIVYNVCESGSDYRYTQHFLEYVYSTESAD